jgi:hypothetical protein
MGVVAVRVASADPPVLAVDEELGMLVPGDLAPGVDRLTLRVVDRGQAPVTFASDTPSIPGWDDVLVLAQGPYSFELGCVGLAPDADSRRRL